MGVAIIAGFMLPDMPHNSTGFSKEELDVAQLRLYEDTGESDTDSQDQPITYGLQLALRTSRLWVRLGPPALRFRADPFPVRLDQLRPHAGSHRRRHRIVFQRILVRIPLEAYWPSTRLITRFNAALPSLVPSDTTTPRPYSFARLP
jgi:hypothetical protein